MSGKNEWCNCIVFNFWKSIRIIHIIQDQATVPTQVAPPMGLLLGSLLLGYIMIYDMICAYSSASLATSTDWFISIHLQSLRLNQPLESYDWLGWPMPGIENMEFQLHTIANTSKYNHPPYQLECFFFEHKLIMLKVGCNMIWLPKITNLCPGTCLRYIWSPDEKAGSLWPIESGQKYVPELAWIDPER